MADDAGLKPLPRLPYKGLTFYTAADVPLFAGRETAVEECTELIRQESTRVLLLHGSTACGKSSFLQAGLIPELERKRFQVDRESDEAIFVTATWEPLRQLVSFVYTLADTARAVPDSSGKQGIGGMVLDAQGQKLPREQFIQSRGSSAEDVLELLAQLCTWLVRRFIIVIDQAEEVLTLRPGANGDKPREEFFRFLALFPKRQLPIKLLVAMRTEYFGKFVARGRESYDAPFVIRDYFLNELTQEQLTQAILKPTQDQPVPGYASTPYQTYRFSYEKASSDKAGAAEGIAASLAKAFSAGGALPVMQIVCANLYKSAVSKGLPAEIPRDDYSSNLVREIAAYLQKTLEEMCTHYKIPAGPEQLIEIRKWERVLAKLAGAGPDGTVTTRVLGAQQLDDEARGHRCVITFSDAADFLKDPERRLLRDRSIYSPDGGAVIPCFSLGHDAIGLVLWRIADARAREKRRAKEARQKELELAAEQAKVAEETAKQAARAAELAAAQSALEQNRRGVAATVRLVYSITGVGCFVWTASHFRDYALTDAIGRMAAAATLAIGMWIVPSELMAKWITPSPSDMNRADRIAGALSKFLSKSKSEPEKPA